LKPENIVVDANGYIKLTDFGLSKEGINDNSSAKSFCGSLAYLAPEIINRQGHGKSVDWYLFGVLMYEMLYGAPPYYTNLSREALFYNIKNAKLNFPKTNNKISHEAKNLIVKLLHRNPNKRLGSGILDADEIKNHSFFSGINFDSIMCKQFIPPNFLLSHLVKETKITSCEGQNYFYQNKEKFPCHMLQELVLNKEICEDMKTNKKSQGTNIEGWTFIEQNQNNPKIKKIRKVE
jgi:serine/threonine protein kinase